jgi:hypothetical protein
MRGRRGAGRRYDVRRARVRALKGPFSLLALAVALSVLVPLATTTPALAANNGSFAVTPASTGSFQRTYFTPVLSPGVSSNDRVAVVNETGQPLKLILYAVDAFTTTHGGFAVKTDNQPKLAMGAWIHLPVSQVTVPARSGEVIPFTYDPPAGVTPGDYTGAIMAEETRGAISGSGSVKVQSIQAVGAAVYGRVIGALRPRLAITNVSIAVTRPIASQFGGPVNATVTYSVTNTGNQNLNPTVTVALSPLVGSSQHRHVRLPQILTGSTVTFKARFTSVWPFGYLSATVTAKAMGAHASGGANAVVVPWLLLLIVVLAVLWFAYRRRRRRRKGATPSEPTSGDDPGDEPSDEVLVSADSP